MTRVVRQVLRPFVVSSDLVSSFSWTDLNGQLVVQVGEDGVSLDEEFVSLFRTGYK